MSIDQVLEKIESELASLHERERFLETMAKEIRGMNASGAARARPGRKARRKGGRKKKAAAKPRTSRAKAKPGRPAKSGRTRTKRGKSGVTVREGIVKALSAASEPLPTAELIRTAGKISMGAVASIRTQMNVMTKEGLLEQLPYEGRGFKYQLKAKSAKK